MPRPLPVSAPMRPDVCGTVPGAALGPVRAIFERPARLRDFRLGHPVARVGRVGIAAVAIVGGVDVADHVVSRQQVAAVGNAQEIRVVEANTGVEHRDDNTRAADRVVPRRFGVDRRAQFRRGRAQIPLARRGPTREPGDEAAR